MTSATPEEQAKCLVTEYLGDRLKDAGEPPGLREAIVDRLAGQLDDLGRRCGEQIGHLRSPSSRRIPDAYLADEEIAENELQAGAAGIQTARAPEGGILSDPRRFEQDLAQRLAPNALWALRSEASRVPRPPTRASVLGWSLTPIPWIENDAEWPPADAVALANVRQLTGTDGEPARVSEDPYKGWVQLGMFERQATLATRHPDVAARHVIIATGLEARDGPPPADSMPLASASPDLWAVCHHLAPSIVAEHARIALSSTRGPIAALIDYEGQPGALGHDRGAGLHRFTLVPRNALTALLGLRPETPALRHVLVDDNGAAIVGRQWRGFLVHDGNYSPLEPAIHGADLLLRPDLYDTLVNIVGKDRLGLGITVSWLPPDQPKPRLGLDVYEQCSEELR